MTRIKDPNGRIQALEAKLDALDREAQRVQRGYDRRKNRICATLSDLYNQRDKFEGK